MPGSCRTLIRSAILATLGAAIAPLALAQSAFNVDVPSQDLADALRVVGRQTSTNIIFEPAIVKGIRVAQLRAEVTADQAIDKLLEGTKLTAQRTSNDTIVVQKRPAAAAPSVATERLTTDAKGDQKSSFWDPFRLARAPSETDVAARSTANSEIDPAPVKLEEIVVTAQKRPERLRDVPVPLTAINAESLLSSNQLRLQDFYSSVPGFSVTPASPSVQYLAVRGITTGPGNPTVGITIDDVPFGASAALGGGQTVPDIDPDDLTRIEILRGPQGTLYGASSMGGLLKYVTTDPSTSGFSGRVQAGATDVHNGDGLGYNLRASVNVPLGATLAVRASGFTRTEPGYIDDPVTGIEGLNEQKINGGRIGLLWQASDEVSLKVSALYQDYDGDGSNDVDTQLSPDGLQQHFLRGTGAYDRKVQAYSATLNATLGSVQMTSITGYNINQYNDSSDALPFVGAASAQLTDNKTDKFTQEVRFGASLGERFEWLIGAFYTDEDSEYVQDIQLADEASGALTGSLLEVSFPSKYKEYAGFADLTYRVSDRFDIQFGGRQSEIKQSSQRTDTGPLVPLLHGGAASPFAFDTVSERNSAFTYLITPRFRVSPNLMVYARAASGYRAGGTNATPGVPSAYRPDKTENYEIGIKGATPGHAVSFDASVFRIDWKDIQLALLSAAGGYTGNGTSAKSEGIELSVEARTQSDLTVGAWVVWNEAELTEDFPPTSVVPGASGDRLPFSGRWSGRVSLRQDFPIAADVRGFVAGSVSYVDDRLGAFNPASVGRQDFDSYTKVDAQAGVTYESWRGSLYVNNLTNRHAFLSGGRGFTFPTTFTLLQPRTIGFSLAKSF